MQVLRELCPKCDEASVNSKNLKAGRTALHIASMMGLVEATKVLLQHGAKVYSSMVIQLVVLSRHRLLIASVYLL